VTGTRRAPARPWQVRLFAVVLVLAALGVGRAILAVEPDTDEREQAYLRSGAVGERIDVRTFDLTVVSVRGAAKVTAFGRDYDTSGVWVVVRVRMTAKVEPTRAGYAAVRDGRGRLYTSTDRFPQSLVGGGRMGQPGVTLEGDVAFEVPTAVATDLVLLVAENSIDQRMSVEAVVPLPIDEAAVARWRAVTQPLPVAQDMVT
jgi:hypothetical protein